MTDQQAIPMQQAWPQPADPVARLVAVEVVGE